MKITKKHKEGTENHLFLTQHIFICLPFVFILLLYLLSTYYVAETATALGISLEEIMEANIEKLKKRYPQGFDADRSVNRES